MPSAMTRTQRARARRCPPPNRLVMRMTVGVLATRSRSPAVVDDDSEAASSRPKPSASARPSTTPTKRSANRRFCGGDSAGSSSMLSVMRHSR